MAAHVRQGDTLFVVARAAETGRTPVAVLKLEAGGLPVAFQLDDRHAMSPQLRLSRFKDVTVQAWISRSGLAQRVPGRPTSAAQSAGSTATDVELVIDQLVP
jgi:cytochrome c-type biogenesis protein CcmH